MENLKANSQCESILRQLRAVKSELRARYHIDRLGVFGSFARNEAMKDSDVDILVEFSTPLGLEVVDLVIELEGLLGKKVDLVSRKAIKPRMLPYIEKDLIYV